MVKYKGHRDLPDDTYWCINKILNGGLDSDLPNTQDWPNKLCGLDSDLPNTQDWPNKLFHPLELYKLTTYLIVNYTNI